MCPVHTPDGSPCGLLNHLAAACEIVVEPPEDPEATRLAIRELLCAAGMVPTQPSLSLPLGGARGLLPVMLDGAYVGVVRAALAQDVVTLLRTKKARGLAARLASYCDFVFTRSPVPLRNWALS